MRNNFYDQDDEYISRIEKIRVGKDYCFDCNIETAKPKYCRSCGRALCTRCAGNDNLCRECREDKSEYVAEPYKYTTKAY